jgi:recombinational DNA repair protein (RecF pathway)
MQDGERVEPRTLAEAAPDVLRCGECEARVDEDADTTNRVRCGVGQGRWVCRGCMCSAPTEKLERAHEQLGRELARRRGAAVPCEIDGTIGEVS